MKTNETRQKGAKSLLDKLGEDRKAYDAKKKIADVAKAAKAEEAWKSNYE